MHISSRAIVLGLLGFAGISSALPSPIANTSTPALANNTSTSALSVNISSPYLSENISSPALLDIINGTDPAFANDTEGFFWLREPLRDRRSRFRSRSLAKRGDLPPRDRTLADHMENHGEGLPECYKKCMRSEDGKSQIHMGQDTLGQICGVKWPLFMWWTEHHLAFCVNGKNGCKGDKPHQDAYNWLKSTCGDKPN